MRCPYSILSALAVAIAASTVFADDGLRLITIDHHVRVKSTAPGFHGQDAQIYVREVVLAGRNLDDGVVPRRTRPVVLCLRH